MDYNITESQFKRTCKDWELVIKGEKAEIRLRHEFLTLFSSEIACLRLYAHYRGSRDVNFGFSSNLNSWYFELKFTDNFAESESEFEMELNQ